MGKKVFFIGGTGFLGSRLLPLLLGAGHEVTVLTRRKEEVAKLAEKGVRGIVGDLMEVEKFLPEVGRHDVTIFTLMPFKPGRISAGKLGLLRLQTTAFVMNAQKVAIDSGSTLIMTGGASFSTSGDQVADESWPIARFGITRIGEDVDPLLADTFARGRPPLIFMLPGQIYGPGGLFLFQVKMMKKGRFRIVGEGGNRIPRIHVEDCAAAFALAVETMPVGHTFILADDVACTQREFSDYLADCLHLRHPGTMPAWIFRLILGRAMAETIAMDCRVSNQKAKAVLGWSLKYPSYKEGLEATCRELAERKD